MTDVNQIQFVTTKDVVVSILGPPVKETFENGRDVLWYGSNAPTLADFIYVDTQGVDLKVTSFYTARRQLADFIGQYGNPEASYKQFAAGTQDSFNRVVHIWPRAGISLVAVGTSDHADIIQETQFAPTTLSQYLATWGKDLAGHEVATVSAISTGVPAAPTVTVNGQGGSITVFGDVFFGFLILVIATVCLLIYRKLFLRRPPPPPNEKNK